MFIYEQFFVQNKNEKIIKAGFFLPQSTATHLNNCKVVYIFFCSWKAPKQGGIHHKKINVPTV